MCPEPFWTGAEYLSPTGIPNPDRARRSESLYLLRYAVRSIEWVQEIKRPKRETKKQTNI
jgi:hypothetical protein